MPTGRVKWFSQRKGYGFLEPDDGTQDVFVHGSDVEASGLPALRPGARVAFACAEKNGKIRAVSLALLTPDDGAPE